MKNIFTVLTLALLAVGCNAEIEPAGWSVSVEAENAVLVDTVAVDSLAVEPAAEALPEVQE